MEETSTVVKAGTLRYNIARDLNDDYHNSNPEQAVGKMRASPWNTCHFELHQEGFLVKKDTDNIEDVEQIMLRDRPQLKVFGQNYFDDQDLTILNLGWHSFESHRQMSFCLQFPYGVRRYFSIDGHADSTESDLKRDFEEWTAAFSRVLGERKPIPGGKRQTFIPPDNIQILFGVVFLKQEGGKCIGSWHERYISLCSDGFLRFHKKKGENPYKIWHVPSMVQSCRLKVRREITEDEVRQKIDLCPAVRDRNGLVSLGVLDGAGKSKTYYLYPYKPDKTPKDDAIKFGDMINRILLRSSDSVIEQKHTSFISDGYPSDVGLTSRILPYEMQAVLSQIGSREATFISGMFIALSDNTKYSFRADNGCKGWLRLAGAKQVIVSKEINKYSKAPSCQELCRPYDLWPTHHLLKINEPAIKFDANMAKKVFASDALPLAINLDKEKTEARIAESKRQQAERDEAKKKKEASHGIRRHDWSQEISGGGRLAVGNPKPAKTPSGGSKSPKGGENDAMKEQMKMMKQQQKFMEKQQKKMFKQYQKNMEEQIESGIDFNIDPNVYIPGIQDCAGGGYIVEGCE